MSTLTSLATPIGYYIISKACTHCGLTTESSSFHFSFFPLIEKKTFSLRYNLVIELKKFVIFNFTSYSHYQSIPLEPQDTFWKRLHVYKLQSHAILPRHLGMAISLSRNYPNLELTFFRQLNFLGQWHLFADLNQLQYPIWNNLTLFKMFPFPLFPQHDISPCVSGY